MDIGSLMNQARNIQQKMEEIKKEAATKTVTSTVGGGMVTAVVNGRQELVSLKIEPAVINSNEAEMLQDLVISAVNDAMRRSQELLQDQMRQLTGGISIPGLF